MPVQPNIVILMADDHRFGAIGSNQEFQVHTPAIERLMAEGTSFERAYTMGGLTGAVCVPSRACLMTGADTFQAVRSRQVDDLAGLQALKSELVLLPELFRNSGYSTYGIGKWHNDRPSYARSFTGGTAIFFGGMGDHFHLPIHEFDPTGKFTSSPETTAGRHATDVFTDAALEFLDQRSRGMPFLLYLAFTAPHDPRTAPSSFMEKYNPREIDITGIPNLYSEHPFDNGDLRVRDELLAPLPRQQSETQKHIADYYTMISHMDARIGDILDRLTSTGLTQDTIVLYLSDHGLGLGQHGLMGKQNMYEHSLRIPFVWRGPGIPAGLKSDRLVQHRDVLPTLCELCRIQAPPGTSGQPLFEAGSESPPDDRNSIMAAYKDQQRCVIESDMKLIQYFQLKEGKSELVYEQLFNLDSDPFETRNLAFSPAFKPELSRLREALKSLQQECQDPLLQ